MSENSVETVYQGDTFRSYTITELSNAYRDEETVPSSLTSVPYAADSVPIVMVYNPSGELVTSGQATESDETGVYYHDIDTSLATALGIWRAQWNYAVSGVQTVGNDYYNVSLATATTGQQYCTSAEIREISQGVDLSGVTDIQLDIWAIRISELIDDYCMRRFGELRSTEQKDGVRDHLGRLFLYVSNLPIVTVHSVTVQYIGQSTTISLDPTKVNWFNSRGYGRYDYTPSGDGTMLRSEHLDELTYTIDYTGGGDVPQAIKMALTLMFENIYQPAVVKTTTDESAGLESSGSNRTLKGYKSGTYAVTYDQGNAEAMFSLNTGKIFTGTVRDLLDHYRKAGQSALV